MITANKTIINVD